jgi:hypothetical protein
LFLILAARPATASAEENLARGRPYKLDPAPSYLLCTDPGDLTQLTDGAPAGGPGRLWTQTGTVGWQNTQAAFVTIDLGQSRAVGGVAVSTAAGTAGVLWPEAIYVLASEDGQAWHLLGDLVALDSGSHAAGAPGYRRATFAARGWSASGRYVAVIYVLAAHRFGFMDEIEVYAAPSRRATVSAEAIGSDLHTALLRLEQRRFHRRRLQRDLEAVRVGMPAAGPAASEGVRLANAIVRARPPTVPVPLRFPVDDLHRSLFALQAQRWRAQGFLPWTVWTASPWDPLRVADAPPRPVPAPRLEWTVLRGDRRARAVDLATNDMEAGVVDVSVSGMPGGPHPPWLEVREVAWIDSGTGDALATALPEALTTATGYRIEVTPGLAAQLWLTVAGALPPGEYHGELRLVGRGLDQRIPMSLRVIDAALPATPALSVGGFDYSNMADRGYGNLTAQNVDALIALLRAHRVSVAWATRGVLPMSTPGGAVPDTIAFDTWVGRWPGAQRYMVFIDVDAALPQQPQFEARVGDWVRFWAEHACASGVRPEQLYLLLVDEPHTAAQDALAVVWARAIRRAATGVQIWEDPTHRPAAQVAPDLLAVSDVLSGSITQIWEDGEARRRLLTDWLHSDRHHVLDLNTAEGPARELDPFAHYRAAAWLAWQLGARGLHIWSFVDGGGAGFDPAEQTGGYDYTPLLLARDRVVTTKQMEALMEGIEDYDTLALLAASIARPHPRASSAALAAARALLERAPASVLAAAQPFDPGDGESGYRWLAAARDRDAAERARLKIIDALVALSQ